MELEYFWPIMLLAVTVTMITVSTIKISNSRRELFEGNQKLSELENRMLRLEQLLSTDKNDSCS
jgi:hypothetical protein